MALSVRCEHCGWLLTLDDAFAGARCRCSHCGDVSDVPANAQAAAPLPRPPRPSERRPIVQPTAVLTSPRRSSKTGDVTMSRSRAAGWTVITALVLILLVSNWLVRGQLEPVSNSTLAAASVNIDRNAVARVPEQAILERLSPSFLDKPTQSPRIAWLIAGGDAMRPYYADVTTLVATSIALLRPNDQQLAVYLASGARPEYVSPMLAGPSATRQVQSVMRAYRPTGEPRLSRAFDEVAAWRPNEVFLLVAQSTDGNAAAAMIQRAKNDSIVVHVVTVGTPNFGWSRVAWLTGGDCVYLRSRDLGTWVDRITSPPLPQFKGQGAPSSQPPTNAEAG